MLIVRLFAPEIVIMLYIIVFFIQEMYNNIVVPISDGKKVFQIVCNLEKAYNNKGKELVKSYQKQIVLRTIDEAWLAKICKNMNKQC